MTDKVSLVGVYRRERRTLELPNFVREDLGTVVRYTPVHCNADGIVCFASLSAGDVVEEIRRHIAHFQAMGVGFEWKVYDSDEPEGLRASLLEAGFVEGDPEALLVYDVASFRPEGRPADGVEVRRVEDIALIQSLVAFQEHIWRRSFEWLVDQLRAEWDRMAFFAAYAQHRLVGTGWISYPAGSQFADLHGGAVQPEFRGRGIYSRLFERRMIDARERGIHWIAVDAAPMSRPILQAKGFQKLDATYPLVWSHQPPITPRE